MLQSKAIVALSASGLDETSSLLKFFLVEDVFTKTSAHTTQIRDVIRIFFDRSHLDKHTTLSIPLQQQIGSPVRRGTLLPGSQIDVDH